MSDHSRALGPIDSWAYSSPELLARGANVDMGQLAESLIYYEQVYVNVANQPQFAEMLAWFVRQGRFDQLLSLFRDGTLTIYEYSFTSAPVYIRDKDEYTIFNMQDAIQPQPDT